MVMNTMPMKYAVPAGSARIKLLIALAARYTGDAARGWDVLDGLHTHPAFQISGRFCYSLGKTRKGYYPGFCCFLVQQWWPICVDPQHRTPGNVSLSNSVQMWSDKLAAIAGVRG